MNTDGARDASSVFFVLIFESVMDSSHFVVTCEMEVYNLYIGC